MKPKTSFLLGCAAAAVRKALSKWVASPGAPAPQLSAVSLITTSFGLASPWETASSAERIGVSPPSTLNLCLFDQIHRPTSLPTEAASGRSLSVVTTTVVAVMEMSEYGNPWNTVQSITPGCLASSAAQTSFISAAAAVAQQQLRQRTED